MATDRDSDDTLDLPAICRKVGVYPCSEANASLWEGSPRPAFASKAWNIPFPRCYPRQFSKDEFFDHTWCIYSGILRLEDLARSLPGCACNLYLVAPNRREREVMAQLARPAFRSDLANISLAFIPFNDLGQHCDVPCKVGDSHAILRKIARCHPVVGAG